jgi:carboxymethylenebutenolidase
MSKQAQKEADTDLVRLWEDHIRHEFETRSTEDTLDTMVEDAYVDHVPVLTGGSGKAELREFYATHFIPRMPPDMQIVPISRTVGRDQLVDEMVIKFTHSVEMDWMLPGIPPTGLRVEVALVVIVRFRDGKLAHNTFIGTKPQCWHNSGCSIRRNFPSLVSKAPKKCSTLPSRATR